MTTVYEVTSPDPITIGSSAINFSTAGLSSGAGIANTSTPSGATAYAMPIYDSSGTLLGYIPVYAAEW